MATKTHEEMTGPELVAEYNRMVLSLGRAPVKKFESRAVGIKRVKAVEDEVNGGIPEFLKRDRPTEVPKVTVEAIVEASREPTEDEKILLEADRRWRNWMPTRESRKRPRRKTFEKLIRKELKAAEKKARAEAREKVSLKTSSKRRRMDQVIRVHGANPRRDGTDAHKYFDAMVGGPTVGEYLAKFPAADHRKALQWLWNTCRDGYAEVLG